MDKPIGWLRIKGRNIWFTIKEPVGKPGIHVSVAVWMNQLEQLERLEKQLRDASLLASYPAGFRYRKEKHDAGSNGGAPAMREDNPELHHPTSVRSEEGGDAQEHPAQDSQAKGQDK